MTNAAGGLNSEYAVGDIVLLNDVIEKSPSTASSGVILTPGYSISSSQVWQELIHWEEPMKMNLESDFRPCLMPMTLSSAATCISHGKKSSHRKARESCTRVYMHFAEAPRKSPQHNPLESESDSIKLRDKSREPDASDAGCRCGWYVHSTGDCYRQTLWPTSACIQFGH